MCNIELYSLIYSSEGGSVLFRTQPLAFILPLRQTEFISEHNRIRHEKMDPNFLISFERSLSKSRQTWVVFFFSAAFLKHYFTEADSD